MVTPTSLSRSTLYDSLRLINALALINYAHLQDNTLTQELTMQIVWRTNQMQLYIKHATSNFALPPTKKNRAI